MLILSATAIMAWWPNVQTNSDEEANLSWGAQCSGSTHALRHALGCGKLNILRPNESGILQINIIITFKMSVHPYKLTSTSVLLRLHRRGPRSFQPSYLQSLYPTESISPKRMPQKQNSKMISRKTATITCSCQPVGGTGWPSGAEESAPEGCQGPSRGTAPRRPCSRRTIKGKMYQPCNGLPLTIARQAAVNWRQLTSD